MITNHFVVYLCVTVIISKITKVFIILKYYLKRTSYDSYNLFFYKYFIKFFYTYLKYKNKSLSSSPFLSLDILRLLISLTTTFLKKIHHKIHMLCINITCTRIQICLKLRANFSTYGISFISTPVLYTSFNCTFHTII